MLRASWSVFVVVGLLGCGEEGPIPATANIVGADGEDETEPFLFPAVVYLEDNSCTGTLISPSHVLTAAHCVDGLGGAATRAPSRVAMRGLPSSDADRVPVARCELDVRYWGTAEPGPGHRLDECRRPDVLRPGDRPDDAAIPGIDFALLTLARPVPHAVSDPAATATPTRFASPVALSSEDPPRAFAALAVGRGATAWTGGGAGPRRYVRFDASWSSPVLSERPSPLGPGDSGGPCFAKTAPRASSS